MKTKATLKSPVSQPLALESSNGLGSITITESALANIVRRAACSVEGVTRLTGSSFVDNLAEIVGSRSMRDRSIRIFNGSAGLSVDLSINISYGTNLPKAASSVQHTVSEEIVRLTGLKVANVDVSVRELEDQPASENAE